MHNDLGFLVNNNGEANYVVLMEAQTEWTDNMTLRLFLYLAETYRRYLIKTNQSEHSKKRIHLPKPELYIVYTGDKEIAPQISLRDTYFEGDAPIDLTVNILRTSGKNTLYGQYIAFCRVYTEQRKIYRDKLECIKKTLEICIQKGYLKEFLEKHRQEVITMLSSLFDEEAQRKQYDIAVKEEAKAEGRAEGEAKGILKTLIGLVKDKILTLPEAATRANMTVEEFEKQYSIYA